MCRLGQARPGLPPHHQTDVGDVRWQLRRLGAVSRPPAVMVLMVQQWEQGGGKEGEGQRARAGGPWKRGCKGACKGRQGARVRWRGQ